MLFAEVAWDVGDRRRGTAPWLLSVSIHWLVQSQRRNVQFAPSTRRRELGASAKQRPQSLMSTFLLNVLLFNHTTSGSGCWPPHQDNLLVSFSLYRLISQNPSSQSSNPNIERPICALIARPGLYDLGSGPRGKSRPIREAVFSLYIFSDTGLPILEELSTIK